jgi:hypothetical protein
MATFSHGFVSSCQWGSAMTTIDRFSIGIAITGVVLLLLIFAMLLSFMLGY